MKRFFLKTVLFTACYFGALFAATAQQSWRPVGSPGFSPDVAASIDMVISSDIPYVAYQDAANGNKATVMKYIGNSWNVVGSAGFSAGQISSMSMAIDNSSVPYVAFKDVANNNKLTVMTYNGSSWVLVGVAGFTAGQADDAKIAVNSSGTPYVLYSDGLYGNKATVMKYNGTSWVIVGTAGFSSEQAMNPDIAIDGSGNVFIVYSGGSTLKISAMKYNGASWSTVGSAGFTNVGSYTPRIALYSGVPYVAYTDGVSYGASVMKYNGSSWSNVGIVNFSAASVDNISIALDGTGTPYVVYRGPGPFYKAIAKKYNGSAWVTVGSANVSTGAAGVGRIAVNSGGIPYVAYADGSNSYKATVMSFSNPPLPVTLVDFTASTENARYKLYWRTATESLGTTFGIERSANGKDFATLNIRAATGNNSSYVYYDEQTSDAPVYYRIKMIDRDGTYIYSKTQVVKRLTGNSASVLVFPVPATDYCTIENHDPALTGTTARVLNMQGVIVATFNMPEGSYSLKMEQWAPDVYFLRLVDGTTLRLVKN